MSSVSVTPSETESRKLQTVLFPAEQSGRVQLVRDSETGLLIFKSSAHTPPITAEVVRAALADFP
jgi:hypothetical protein